MIVRGKENNSKEVGNKSEQQYKGNMMERSRKRKRIGTGKQRNGKGKEGAERRWATDWECKKHEWGRS